jgi:glucose-6-phosphate 1-dehydrogenase
MLQVLASVLADPPAGQGAESWMSEKANVISAIRPLDAEHTVRGQYEGYLDVAGVDPASRTESYVAVRLAVDSWRWADVPVVIRAGKCMPVTATEVSFRFRRPPKDIIGLQPSVAANRLRFRIWPDSEVGLKLIGKKPGAGWQPQVEDLAFAQHSSSSDMRPYDRLIGAALDGHRWLFARQDTVEAAWRIVDPVLSTDGALSQYARGTWGPKEADNLLPDGDVWHDPAG